MRPLHDKQKLLIGLAILVLALLGLRIALPDIVRHEINVKADKLGAYHGHVDDVDIHLWRGAYSLIGFNIEKPGGKVPVPLLKAPRIDLSVSWKEIFHGGIVAEVEFDHPEVNFVDGRGTDEGQSGRGVDWRQQLERLLPIRMNEVRVVDGTLFFRNFVSHPPVDLKATQLDAQVYNLTNVRSRSGERVADLKARANILGQAPLELEAKFDPLSTLEDFTFDMKLTDVDLTRLNALFQAYGKIDVASGRGDIVMQLESRNGQLGGYVKPLLHDVKIADWKQDVEEQHDNPFRLAWEWAVGLVKGLFKNQPENQFATRVPITGNIKDPKTGTLDAIFNVLHNAFVEAYKPQFENLGKADGSGGK